MPNARRDASAHAALNALRRIVRYLRLADREVGNVCGLSVAQLFVLHQLADTPALSIAEVAERAFTDPSSVSTVVSRLVEQGLVGRKPARNDRRRVELTLTARGHRVVLTAPRVPQLAIIESIRSMSLKRRAELVRSLESLASLIGANAVEPRMLFEDEPARVMAPRPRRIIRRTSTAPAAPEMK
jgi:DNA-binding MarR family transcriptional regulator